MCNTLEKLLTECCWNFSKWMCFRLYTMFLSSCIPSCGTKLFSSFTLHFFLWICFETTESRCLYVNCTFLVSKLNLTIIKLYETQKHLVRCNICNKCTCWLKTNVVGSMQKKLVVTLMHQFLMVLQADMWQTNNKLQYMLMYTH